jgi:hypothetical protein
VILTGQLTGTRFQKVFPCPTRISVQVIGAHTVILSREQGEANAANDGIQLTQGSTANPSQPYETWWQGELWYRTSIANGQFVMLILVEGKQ